LPVEVAQARARRDLAEQSRVSDDRDVRLIARVAERFEAPPPDALRLDATEPPELIAKAILAWLEQIQ
jgi:hypothetical protein